LLLHLLEKQRETLTRCLKQNPRQPSQLTT
jgi:hypothetical protein